MEEEAGKTPFNNKTVKSDDLKPSDKNNADFCLVNLR